MSNTETEKADSRSSAPLGGNMGKGGPTPLGHTGPIEADRRAIEALLVRYCSAIDTCDWELLDTCFTPDAFVDYTSSGGTSGRYPEVRAWLAQVLPAFVVRQHLVTNFRIEVDGDRATSRAYLYNPMGRSVGDGKVQMFFVGGEYADELIRTAEGWRITRRVERQLWVDVRA